MNISNKTA